MEPWSKEVRVNASGCLGHCERGISAVLYPQGEWFFDLTDSSTDLLFAAVKAAVEKSK
jgi:(2Fe-2S) ferredoxin